MKSARQKKAIVHDPDVSNIRSAKSFHLSFASSSAVPHVNISDPISAASNVVVANPRVSEGLRGEQEKVIVFMSWETPMGRTTTVEVPSTSRKTNP